MSDTAVSPVVQSHLLGVVRHARAPISTRMVSLRARLSVPVASKALNDLADFGILGYDTTAEGWVTRG